MHSLLLAAAILCLTQLCAIASPWNNDHSIAHAPKTFYRNDPANGFRVTEYRKETLNDKSTVLWFYWEHPDGRHFWRPATRAYKEDESGDLKS